MIKCLNRAVCGSGRQTLRFSAPRIIRSSPGVSKEKVKKISRRHQDWRHRKGSSFRFEKAQPLLKAEQLRHLVCSIPDSSSNSSIIPTIRPIHSKTNRLKDSTLTMLREAPAGPLLNERKVRPSTKLPMTRASRALTWLSQHHVDSPSTRRILTVSELQHPALHR